MLSANFWAAWRFSASWLISVSIGFAYASWTIIFTFWFANFIATTGAK